MTAGVVLWFMSLPGLALRDMTDLGLASVLPAGIWASFALVTAGCAVAWRCGSVPVMAVGVLATILVLFGLGVLGEPTMRFAQTWQHVGITAYIAAHGTINPNIDAYFNWPGFFILGAFISSAAGLHNMEPIARAAPLFYNAMYFLPLVAIGQSLFNERRLVWLGVWLFFVNNWIGQDYYSPQGFAFFLYLVVLAVLLRWFRSPRAQSGRLRRRLLSPVRRLSRAAPAPLEVASAPSQRIVLASAIILISAAIITSHQLTPFALIFATGALSLIGWNRLRGLLWLILLMTTAWMAYFAWVYLLGHLNFLAGDVGALNATVSSNVGGRLHGGSVGHELIVKARLATTGILWLVAAAGFLRQARLGRLNLGAIVLAAAPFCILALQSYGGEALLRVALFSMPFMCFSVASLFLSAGGGLAGRTAGAALAGFVLLLVFLFPFNRYGNERMDYYPKDELTGVATLYRDAPAGSYLFASDDGLPWRYEKYADYYYYASLTNPGGGSVVNLDQPNARKLARLVARAMRAPGGRRSFLIITRTTEAESDLFGPWARGAQIRLRHILARSSQFRTVFQNRDAAIFELKRGAPAAAAGARRRSSGGTH